MPTEKPVFCPLCGAHEFEHGEGTQLEQLDQWKDRIRELYYRLFPPMVFGCHIIDPRVVTGERSNDE